MASELKTHRFGSVTYEERDLLRFSDGMPGFEDLRRFLLVDNPNFQPFKFLQSLDNPAISFPLIEPGQVVDSYRLRLSEKQKTDLELAEETLPLVYCIVTISEDIKETTVNLFAPLVVNPLKMKVAQVILFDSGYPVRHLMFKSTD